jgi:hypothetical protein
MVERPHGRSNSGLQSKTDGSGLRDDHFGPHLHDQLPAMLGLGAGRALVGIEFGFLPLAAISFAALIAAVGALMLR